MPEIRLTLSEKTLNDLDEFAEVAEVTRSELIRDLLTYAMDRLEDDPQLVGPDEPLIFTDADTGEEFEIDPGDLLTDADGNQYFVSDEGRTLRDGTWVPRLLPLEFGDEGDGAEDGSPIDEEPDESELTDEEPEQPEAD